MANDIGSVKGVSGTSHSLNNQSGQGAVKPVVSPGEGPHAPPKPAEITPAMPK